jgi:hypothetical protein
MKKMASKYSQASSCFKNISQFTVITHKVEDRVVADITRAVGSIFKTIEKLDDDAKELVGLLWVFKTILNSTLIPLDDPLLQLYCRYREILIMLKKHSIDPVLLRNFEMAIEPLWSKHKNKKFDRILSISESFDCKSESIGLLGKILYGDDLACINLTISHLSNFGLKFSNIETKRQLKNSIYQKMFIASPPMRASIDLVKTIFYSGVTPEVNLVLYEHENFYTPSRLELPISPEFKKSIQKFKASKIIGIDTAAESNESDLNSWPEENFWIDIHGGSRTKTAQSIPAHYILFEGGEGTFMPVQGQILHLDKNGTAADNGGLSYDLSRVDILDLLEGDYVLLRKNSSGFLFNEEFDTVDDEKDDGRLDKITDWKNALSALLLTKSYVDIAVLMKAKGVAVALGKIKQWEGVDVIAPNSEAEFNALIEVLGDEGKLSPSIINIKAYVAERWNAIHEYRVSRQKAGSRARQAVLEGLLAKIEGLDIDSSDGAKNLDSQLGQNILIKRIASIDQSTSYVHQSRLFKIDDLRGNKWLR